MRFFDVVAIVACIFKDRGQLVFSNILNLQRLVCNTDLWRFKETA